MCYLSENGNKLPYVKKKVYKSTNVHVNDQLYIVLISILWSNFKYAKSHNALFKNRLSPIENEKNK